MAAVTKYFGTVALNGATEVTVTLDEEYMYEVRHTGVDAAGTADANAQLTAYLSWESGLAAVSMAEEDDKYPLMYGQAVYIGPGISTLYIDAVANSDGILAFSRVGTLTRRW